MWSATEFGLPDLSRPIFLDSSVSQAYVNLGLYKTAITYIDKAISIKDDSFYSTIRQSFETAPRLISIKLVTDKKAVNDFYSAEKQFFDNIVNENFDLNVSNVALMYCAGIEQILHVHFAQDSFNDTMSKNEVKKESSKYFIPKPHWFGDKRTKIKPLPDYLRSLCKGNGITFGQWTRIFKNEIHQNSTNIYEKDFIDSLKQKVTEEMILVFNTELEKLTPIRNSSAHFGDQNLEELESLRVELIDSMNSLIEVIYLGEHSPAKS